VVQPQELMSLPSAKIHVTSRMEVRPEDAEVVLARVLGTCHLALVPLDAELGLWECVSTMGRRRMQIANRLEIVTEQDLRDPDHGERRVWAAARLERTNAQAATNACGRSSRRRSMDRSCSVPSTSTCSWSRAPGPRS
jgi:hypothetical protein